MACLDLEDALAAFLEWLEVLPFGHIFNHLPWVCACLFISAHNQELGGDVVLVAHKCLDYDAKVSNVYVRILSCVHIWPL